MASVTNSRTRRVFNPKLGEYQELDPELQILVEENLPRAAERHRIDISDRVLKYKNNVHRRGDKAEKITGTLIRYDTQYRQLWGFLAKRGAWDSMLLLLFPKRTAESTNCPAMDVEELCHFVRSKMNPPGIPLRDGNNEDSNVLTDIFGTPMTCGGGWKAGKTMDMFGTSLSSIHKVHLHAGPYLPSCPDCQANETTIKEGCYRHKTTRKSLAFRSGNPSLSNDFITNKNTLEDPNYQAKVSTQIDPGDVRGIRKATIGGIPTLAGLKFYVMTLISIKLFLRADEVIKIKVSDLPPKLFHRIASIVRAVGVNVTGKTDKGRLRWFLLFADDDYPDICALRHLLIYIFFMGIREGYLFPPDKDIHHDEVGGSGIYVRNESYSQFLRGLKKLAENGAFEYDKKSGFRATIHIFRKGAYCFRVIASKTDHIDWTALRYDARHEKEADMFIYVRDANTLRQTIDFVRNPEMRVSDNRSVRFETECAAVKIIGKSSDATRLTLHQLATDYVTSLGLGPTPSLREALAAALKPRDYNFERQKDRFVDTLTREQTLMFTTIYDYIIKEQQRHLRVQAAALTTTRNTLPEQPAKRRKKVVDPTKLNDLEYEDISRSKVKDIPTIKGKIEAFKTLKERLPEQDKDLTAGAKKWVILSLRPALNCLDNHHDGDIDRYVAAWDGRFKMKHICSGKSNIPCAALD